MPTIVFRLVLVFALAAPLMANAQSVDRADEALVIATEGFLAAHPDLRHRIAGQKAYREGDHAGALVRGYIWMDLAGERGYPLMLAKRERYWRALDEVQRARSTGSRTGVPGHLRILINTPAGPQEIDGSRYYDEKYWDPEQYFAWQDRDWVPPTGRVDVGEIVSGAAADAAPAGAD